MHDLTLRNFIPWSVSCQVQGRGLKVGGEGEVGVRDGLPGEGTLSLESASVALIRHTSSCFQSQ